MLQNVLEFSITFIVIILQSILLHELAWAWSYFANTIVWEKKSIIDNDSNNRWNKYCPVFYIQLMQECRENCWYLRILCMLNLLWPFYY